MSRRIRTYSRAHAVRLGEAGDERLYATGYWRAWIARRIREVTP